MATSSVHFEPTTHNFGKLTFHTLAPEVSLWSKTNPSAKASLHGRFVSTNMLIGLFFVLAFVVALSGLYLIDQAVFSSSSATVANAQNAAYSGALIDYN